MSWTDERVELLKKMWNEGHSASQIAKELGGVTRNAVIGKVHRLGLSNRNGGESEAAPPPPEAATPQPEAPVVDLAQAKAAREASRARNPVAEPEATADRLPTEEVPAPAEKEVVEQSYTPRPITPAGQPLPPQPSTNEIDPAALATVREVEKTARKLSLMELTERTCKWPIGDPATNEFWFCGLPVAPGKPYCEAHVAVAFQPMNTRRDRRR